MKTNSFILLDDFLLDAEKKFLLNFINDDGFKSHYASTNGKKSPLMFKPINFRNFENVKLMKMLPDTTQEMHIDETIKNKRKSVLIHPLTNNYAPCITKDGPVYKTAILNTQSEHAVFNNNSIRLNLQIAFDIDFHHFLNEKHSIWKTINTLYI